MMANRGKNVSVILGRLIYIGFSVQIVFGIAWMFANIGYVQMFGEASYNMTLSSFLRGDGDTGILYPAIILLVRALGEITFVPWFSYLYILQIVLAFFSGYFLIKESNAFGEKNRRYVWGSFVLLTFPPIMQIHMAIMINSLLLSLLMLQAAFLLKAWKCIKKSHAETADYVYSVSGVALFWLLMSLTKWSYVFIGAIPVIATVIGIVTVLIKGKAHICDENDNMVKSHGAGKAFLLVLLTVMLFGGIVFGIDRLVTDNNVSVRYECSINKLIFNRISWKSRFSRPDKWLSEIEDIVGNEVMQGTMLHQDNLKLLLEPELEEKVGIEEAERIYKYANQIVWKYDRTEFLHDLVIDAAGYALPQLMIERLLNKNSYISYTPRNFDSFKRNTPVLAKYYLDYSLIWFDISFVCVILIVLIRMLCKLIKIDRRMIGAVCAEIITCICVMIYNVMLGNSMYDYKLAGSAMIAWFMFEFVLGGKAIFDEDVK